MSVSAFVPYKYLLLTLTVASFLLAAPFLAQAQVANECGFSRTLEMGMDGEDVRCLQKFLNAAGFEVSETGPGSPGNETSLFRTLTKEAVVEWQKAHDVSPSSGIFGPVSQAAYLLDLIDELESTVAQDSSDSKPTAKPEVAGAATSVQKQATKLLEGAFLEVWEAEEQVEAFPGGKTDQLRLEADLRTVRYDLYAAWQDFFAADYREVKDLAADVQQDAAEVKEAAGAKSDSSTARNVLYDAQDEYDYVLDQIEETDADRKSVAKADDILRDAELKLRRADAAYDDADWEATTEFAQAALKLTDKALRVIDGTSSGSKNQAKAAIDDVWDEYLDARDEVDYTEEKTGTSMSKARDLLDEVKELVKDADDAVDDGDWDDALDYADEAQEVVDEVLDEL